MLDSASVVSFAPIQVFANLSVFVYPGLRSNNQRIPGEGFFKLFNLTVFLGHLSNRTLMKAEYP
jgi:hypothetical protein